jgi:hypothetical protein
LRAVAPAGAAAAGALAAIWSGAAPAGVGAE